MINLDVKDKKLIKELENNSFLPISQIAKRIGTSKEVAHYRLNKLIDSGLIKRFHTIIDYFKLDFRFYILAINLQNLKYAEKKTILNELRKEKNIEVRVYLSSNWDFEISIWVKDSKEFYEFYDNFIAKYAEHIAEKEISIITKQYILNHTHLHTNKNAFVLGEDFSKAKIDDTDLKIIEELELNPKEEIVQLSKKMKISPNTLNYRIKNLIKNKILRAYLPVIDTSLLGYNVYKVRIILNNPSRKNTVIKYLSNQPNVKIINELIGNKDLDFEIDCRTTIELDNFLEKLRLETPEIKDFQVIDLIIE
jgi:DNA-binding Lrp family transcriptional regulator